MESNSPIPCTALLAAAATGTCLLSLPEGTILESNAALRTLLGLELAELAGRPLAEFAAPDCCEPIADRLRRLAATGTEPPFRCALKGVAGCEVPVLIDLAPLPPGIAPSAAVALITDLTPLNREAPDRGLGDAVFATVAEAIFVADAACRIQTVNPAFTRITGFTQEEVVGKTPSLLAEEHHPPDYFRQIRQALTRDGRWQGELWNRRKNGEVFVEWLSIVTVRDGAGQILRFVGAFSDITRRKEAEAVILRQANYDSLTDLPNRTLFHDRLTQVLRRAERRHLLTALLFVDLDHFKEVNDSLGHAAGDKLLREAAQRLTIAVRKEDTVARLGGDEFTVILPELNAPEAAAKVARKLLHELTRPFFLESREFRISASIGIALFPDDGHHPEPLLLAADQAMYRAKREGRNGYWFANRGLGRTLDRFDILRRDLPEAIRTGGLHFLYQPVVGLQDERMVAIEATPRWVHPQLGPVLPEEIRDAAQESHAEGILDDWGLDQVGADIESWNLDARPLRVMLRLHDLEHPRALGERLRNWRQRHPQQAARLALVVDEPHLNRGDAQLVDVLVEAGAAGISVAIDHYGAGYTPFSHMLRLPLGWLKIDRGLVNEALMGDGGASQIESIIRMARAWNLKVIAGGIESHEQHWLMKVAGCDLGVGGRFFGPLESREVARRLMEPAPGGEPPASTRRQP